MKSIDRFSSEETARLLRNAEHDRQWLEQNRLLDRPGQRTHGGKGKRQDAAER